MWWNYLFQVQGTKKSNLTFIPGFQTIDNGLETLPPIIIKVVLILKSKHTQFNHILSQPKFCLSVMSNSVKICHRTKLQYWKSKVSLSYTVTSSELIMQGTVHGRMFILQVWETKTQQQDKKKEKKLQLVVILPDTEFKSTKCTWTHQRKSSTNATKSLTEEFFKA